MTPFKRKLINMSEKKAEESPADAGALIGKPEEINAGTPAELPSAVPEKSEAYGFKLGKKVLQMTVTATEITKVEPDDDSGLMEVKYKLSWQGIAGRGMEKDVTIRFVMDTPDGTEEILLQQEMMALMQEAKRKIVD